MTDEEIIALAEKTRKEKFCPQYRERLFEHRDDVYDCSCRCPVSYAHQFDIQCGDTIYEQGFLDGFKAAAEASRATGVCARNIKQVAGKEEFCPGHIRKQAGGFIWEQVSR